MHAASGSSAQIAAAVRRITSTMAPEARRELLVPVSLLVVESLPGDGSESTVLLQPSVRAVRPRRAVGLLGYAKEHR
jgi:hypothetical protein